MEREKQKSPQLNPLRSSSSKNLTGQGRSEVKVSPEIEARYLALSPMLKETVDNLVSSGLSMEKVINGIRS